MDAFLPRSATLHIYLRRRTPRADNFHQYWQFGKITQSRFNSGHMLMDAFHPTCFSGCSLQRLARRLTATQPATNSRVRTAPLPMTALVATTRSLVGKSAPAVAIRWSTPDGPSAHTCPTPAPAPTVFVWKALRRHRPTNYRSMLVSTQRQPRCSTIWLFRNC